MGAADKLWFELGVRDEISNVLENLMRSSDKLADMLANDADEMKSVYKNILDISNVYDKIYVTQKRISDLKGAKTLTADEKKGLQEMSKELENVRKEFAAILKNPDRATSKGEAQFEKTRLNIELMLKDTLRYVDNIEAKERAEAKNAANESKRIDDLKAKYYELQRYRKQLSDAIVGASPNVSIGGATKRLSQSLDYRMNQVSSALQNGGSMPNSARGADFEKFLQDVKTKITELTSATNDYNSRLEANKQIQSALNKLSADAISQQKIAGIRRQTVEYAALGRKIQEIQALMQNVSNENGLLMSGRITSPTWTREKVTEELNAIQRRYNETLAAGRQRELDDAVGMLAHVNEGLISSYNRVAEAGNRANRITIQLQNQIGAYAGLYGLERVLRSIVTIGGQFEVQHVALQNILGDVQQANILFGQLKELAIESPKTFMELTSYAKQLSAYQIPANELYDTTKRLADMSSGLGVDMNRLILAYGQVRSAAVLRGQELRQFTEAGIPMVQALADKFTQLNGKLTTTADVFKLISARAVPFEMVKEVLWDMTSQGGQFFNMQEELANTLYGKWQKLQDSWQIMLGSIAEGTSAPGFLFKHVLDFAVLLTQNLDKMVLALTALGAAKGIKYMAEGLRSTTMRRSGEMAIENMRIAKIQEANRLERERVWYGRKLEQAELDLIRNKNKLVSSDYQILALENQITAKKAHQLMLDGQMSKQHFYRYLQMQGYTREQRKQIALGQLQALQQGPNPTPMGKMGKWLGIGAKGALGFFGGWVGLAITAAGVAASVYSTIKESDERLNDLVNSISGSAEQNANQLANTLKNVGDSSDEPFKKVEALEEALIGMGNAGKQVVQDSRGFDDINERLENLVKNAKAYQEALDAMGTPGGKSAIKGALDKSDLNDEMDDYEDLQNAEFKAQSALERYSSKYQQMIDALKTKHKELAEELNGKNLYENLRLLMTGSYANEAFGYFAGNTPYGSAIRDYAKAVEESEAHLENIKNNVIPDAMNYLKVLARQAGVDISKSYEELTEAEKTKLRTIATNFANGLEKGSQDAKNSIASWVAQGFYTQLYITPVINTNDLTGLPYELDQWQKGKGYGLWSKNDLKEANSDFIAFSKKQSQRKVDLENKIKDYDTQLNGTVLDPDLVPTIRGQRQALQSELDQLNDSLKDGQWIFDNSLTKGQSKGGKKTDEQLKGWKEELKEIENFYKVYKRNVEYMSKDEAIQKALDSGVFLDPKKLPKNIDDYLTVLRDFKDKVKKEIDKTPTTERKSFLTELLTKIDEKEFEIKTKDAAEKLMERLKIELQRQSKSWNLYNELLGKTGNKEFASKAFANGQVWNDQARSLAEQLQDAMVANLNPDGKMIIDWDAEEQSAKDYFEKNFKNGKALFEIWQKIVELLHGGYVDVLKNGADAYEKTFTTAQKIQKVEQEIRDLEIKRQDPSNDAVTNNSLDKQIDAKEKELSKLNTQLKNETGDFLQFFTAVLSMTVDEAESAGRAIRENLVQQLRDGEISGEDYVKKISKIDSQLEKVRSKKNMFELFKSGGIEAVKKFKLEVADEELTNSSNKLKEEQDKLRDAEEKLREAVNKLDETMKNDNSSSEDKQQAQEGVEQAQEVVDAQNGNLVAAENNQEAAQQNRDAAKKSFMAAKQFGSTVSIIAYIFSAWAQAYDDAKKAAAAFGENLDANLSSEGQYVMGSMQGISSGLQRMQSGDFAGAISGAVFGTISSIAQMHDETIKEDQKNSQNLAKIYENMISMLEKRLDSILGGIYSLKASDEDVDKLYDYMGTINPDIVKNVWSGKATEEELDKYKYKIGKDLLKGIFDPLQEVTRQMKDDTKSAIEQAIDTRSYYDVKYANLLIQRDELMRQLEGEEDLKNRDDAKVEDYKQQIKELELEIDNFAEEMAKSLYSIDIKSWASQLGDALFEAWKKGEDGAEAFAKKSKELIADVAKNMVAMSIIEEALQPVLDTVKSEMKANGGKLDTESISLFAAKLGDAMEWLPNTVNEAYDKIDEEVQKRGLGSLKDDESSSSSSSAAVSRTINEEQANRLVALVETIRADVSVDRLTMQNIYDVIKDQAQMPVIAQAQLQQLEMIAANTSRNADAADRIYAAINGLMNKSWKVPVA